MCCALAALLIGALAAWRRWSAAALEWRPHLRRAAACVACAIALMTGIALAAEHADHYAGRAEANGRSLLAEIWARPICSGVSSDRADADVSPPG
ncbi:hypothetical protein SAMN05519104_1134 [Rhizobiales bacterium GAS188]|jgi:hypothetical protein|nr:hypothetical protein SAMN05519104_1134 [Rhizobiales bacterium GAS188]